jgi:hypothetical protein
MSRISPADQFERALREHRTRVDIDGATWVKLSPGTVLMPREATPQMVAIAERQLAVHTDFALVYRTMVGARPTIPV